MKCLFLIICAIITLVQCAPLNPDQNPLTRVRRTKNIEGGIGLGGFLDGFLGVNKRRPPPEEDYPQNPPHPPQGDEEVRKGISIFKELNLRLEAGLDHIKKGLFSGIGFDKNFDLNLNIGVGGSKDRPQYTQDIQQTPVYEDGITNERTKYIEHPTTIKVPETPVVIPEVEKNVTVAYTHKTEATVPEIVLVTYTQPDTDGNGKLDLRNNEHL